MNASDRTMPSGFRQRLGETRGALIEEGPFVAAVRSGPGLFRPLLARHRHLVAVGDVRLDNRAEVAALAGSTDAASDLELALRAIDAQGEKVVSALHGDFGFVVWDARAHKLLAIRDAFGVKPLYYRPTNDLLLFAPRADVLATGEEYDIDYISTFIAGLIGNGEGRTIWAGVREIPAGGCLLQRGTLARGWTYWSPDSFEPELAGDDLYYEDQFLALFRDAVRSRLGPLGTTWAQLSGGIDSSSVVAMAQNVAGSTGLAGTLTIVDTLGAGDERRYVDSVLRRYDLRNERVIDRWPWQEGDHAPPVTDAPRPLYPFFTRDGRAHDIVRCAGGRVVLSGFGSDHYLMGNFGYMADNAARGEVRSAARELASWAVGTRQSFWGLAREHVVSPLMRSALHRQPEPPTPGFISHEFARSTRFASRLEAATAQTGKPGNMFASRVARDVRAIPGGVDRWPFGAEVEIRYPFLHRPLVEACLRMPASMRIRPTGTKWVLRQAMRGLLPEKVRTRTTKGLIDARILWALGHERARIDNLLRDPILAQLGCIEPVALRAEVERAITGQPGNLTVLMSVLSLETWLAVRNGRWASLGGATRSAA